MEAARRNEPMVSASAAPTMHKFVLIFLTAIVLTGCGESDEARQARIAAMPIELKLATLDGTSREDIHVARIRELLRQLSATYGETPERIADMTVAAQSSMREAGVAESLESIMEGLNRLAAINLARDEYAGHAAVYVTLRKKGFSHDDAIESLSALLIRLQ